MQFSNESQFRVLSKEFEALHGISPIIGEIDKSRIPILAPFIGGKYYSCRKSFHFTLLQGIVNTNCVFWDYEFGWAGSMHDRTVFQLTKVGKMCI